LGLYLVVGNQLQLDAVGENAEWIRYTSGHKQNKGGVRILLAGVGLAINSENAYIMRTYNEIGLRVEYLSYMLGNIFPATTGLFQKMPVYGRALAMNKNRLMYIFSRFSN
jgi:hypothetical protein